MGEGDGEDGRAEFCGLMRVVELRELAVGSVREREGVAAFEGVADGFACVE